MENNHLTSFEVSGFKKFTDLKIDNLGQFNLIVGDNNVGKTSLLEALLCVKQYNVFFESLAYVIFSVKKFTGLKIPFFNHFFSTKSEGNNLMVFTEKHFDPLFFENSYTFKKTNNYSFQYTYENNDIWDDSTASIKLEKDDYKEISIENIIPFVPFGNYYSHDFTEKYSQHIQIFVDKKELFINALSTLIPNIKNIEVNAGITNGTVLLIAEEGKNILSPLGLYGDGALKLFRILISLIEDNPYYSRLMIDELDAGIHYSRLKVFIKSLIITAKNQKKQIFATTHSKECIQCFIEALEELNLQSEGRIIRLAETKAGIKAYTMQFEEFENALNAESEIR